MRQLVSFISIFLVIGCANDITKEDLVKLNGYWEIAEVEFDDGQKKEYKVNPSIDYIEFMEMEGFKKKVYPRLDGSYDTSNDAENFVFLKKDDHFLFSYKNALAEWEEKLIKLDEETFSIINQDKIKYTYKRYEPINIE